MVEPGAPGQIPKGKGKVPSKGVPRGKGILPGQGVPKDKGVKPGEGILPGDPKQRPKGAPGQIDRGSDGQMDKDAPNPWALPQDEDPTDPAPPEDP